MASITETGMRTTGVEEEMKVTGVEMTGELFFVNPSSRERFFFLVRPLNL